MPGKDFERIENLKKKLYSRASQGTSGIRAHELHEKNISVARGWDPESSSDSLGGVPPESSPEADPSEAGGEPRHPVLRKFLIFSVLFFLASVSYAGYRIFYGNNVVSPENIQFAFFGPGTIRGGEALSVQISMKNRNSQPLQDAYVFIEYPKGSRKNSGNSETLAREKKFIGEIRAGSEARFISEAVIFALEGSAQKVDYLLQYKIPNSNAIFEKEVSYEFLVGSPPLSLSVISAEEARDGQEIAFTAEVSSNSEEVLKNVLLRAEYPAGFTFTNSDPAPYREKSIWRIGDLPPQGKRTFTVRGKLFGVNEDQKFFRFDAGLEGDKEQGVIDTILATKNSEVKIQKDSFSIRLFVNGENAPEIVVRPESQVDVRLSYENTTASSLRDAEILVTLEGLSVDESSVRADGGFYDSSRNVIRFDTNTAPALADISPGSEGSFSFTFSRKKAETGRSGIRDPEVLMTANASAKRTDGGDPTTLSVAKRTVKFETEAEVDAALFFFEGPFESSGPLPPKVEQETTYTALFLIGTASNDLSDAEMKMILPPNVVYKNLVSPAVEKVFFNNSDRMLTWKAGFIKAGTGFSTPSKRMYLQLTLTPSANQTGTVPLLVENISFSAKDRFTGSAIQKNLQDLKAELLRDGQAPQGHQTVVP